MIKDLTGQLNYTSEIVLGSQMTVIFHTSTEGNRAGFSAIIEYSTYLISFYINI